MVIGINDSLLEEVKKEILDTLQATESRVVDIFDFGETQGSDEVLGQLSIAGNALLMIGEKNAAALCDTVRTTISQSLTNQQIDDEKNDKLAAAFLALTQYVKDLSVTESPGIDLGKVKALLQGEGVVYQPDEQQRGVLLQVIKKLGNIRSETAANTYWQYLYKLTKVAKDQVSTHENYEYIWLVQQQAMLNVKHELATSDADADKTVKTLAAYLQHLCQSGETVESYHKISEEITALQHLAGAEGALRSDFSPPIQRLVLDDDLDIIFPVSARTIEAIAYLIKKELAVTRNLFEDALAQNTLQAPQTKQALAETLKASKAAFDLLAFDAATYLIEEIESLLQQGDFDGATIEHFTRNIVLVEDALWQLDYLGQGNVVKSGDLAQQQQQQHARNIAVNAAKIKTAANAYQLFKQARDQLIEHFSNPTQMNLMRLAGQVHKVKSTCELLGETTLVTQLQKTEQAHLFLAAQTAVLKKEGVNKAYLDLLVTYEIIFEQLQNTIEIDRRALKLLEATQQRFIAAIKLAPEQMASPDYMHYGDGAHTVGETDETVDTEVTEIPEISEASDTPIDDSDATEQKAAEESESTDADELADSEDEALFDRITADDNLSLNEEVASASADEVDEEILEIFTEESQGIVEQLEQDLPKLKEDYFNKELIGDLRRAFHTLKGSGRMVGLNVFGEFAWQHEELLNRAIAGEIEINDIAHKQLSDACALVRSTVFSTPLDEDREALLKSAARAEAVKKALLDPSTIPPAPAVSPPATADMIADARHETASDAASTSETAHTVGTPVAATDDMIASLSDEAVSGLAQRLSTVPQSAKNAEQVVSDIAEHPALTGSVSDSDASEGGALSASEQVLQDYVRESEPKITASKQNFAEWEKDNYQRNQPFDDLKGNIDSLTAEGETVKHADNRLATATLSDTLSQMADSDAEIQPSHAEPVKSAIDDLSRMHGEIAEGKPGYANTRILQDLAGVGATMQVAGKGGESETATAQAATEVALQDYVRESEPKIAASKQNFAEWEGDNYQRNQPFDDLKGNIDSIAAEGESIDHINNRLVTGTLSGTMQQMADSEVDIEQAHAEPVKSAIDDLSRMHQEIATGQPGQADTQILQDLAGVGSAMQGGLQTGTASADAPDGEATTASTTAVIDGALQDYVRESEPKIAASQQSYAEWEGDSYQRNQPFNDLKGNIDNIAAEGESVKHTDNRLITATLAGTMDQLADSGLEIEQMHAEPVKSAIDDLSRMHQEIAAGESGEANAQVLQDLVKVSVAMKEGASATAGEQATIKASGGWQVGSVGQEATGVVDGEASQTAQAAAVSYPGTPGELSDKVDDLRRQFSPSNLLSGNFRHDSLIESIYDLEASIDTKDTPPWAWEFLSNMENAISSMRQKSLTPSASDYQKIAEALKAIESPQDIDDGEAKKINNDLMGIRANLSAREARAHKAQEFSNNAHDHLAATDMSFSDWQKTGYRPDEKLSGLIEQIDNVRQDADRAEYNDIENLSSMVKNILNRIQTEDIIPFDPVADTVEEAISKIMAAEAQMHGDGIEDSLLSDLSRYVNAPQIGSVFAPSMASQIEFSDSEPTENMAAYDLDEQPAETAQPAYNSFAFEADPYVSASREHFDNWERTGFSDEVPLERLSGSVRTITDISEKHNFDSAAQLGNTVSDILDRLYDGVMTPSTETAEGVNDAISEFDRATQAIIQDTDEKEISSNLISAVQAIATMSDLGQPVDLDLDAQGYSEATRQRQAQHRAAAGTGYAADGVSSAATATAAAATTTSGRPDGIAEGEPVESGAVEGQVITTLFQQFAEDAEPHIEASKGHFSDWEESDFEHHEPLGRLTDSVQDITDVSQKHRFKSATDLGLSVGDVLKRLKTEKVKPHPETGGHVGSALDEFERSAQSAKSGSGNPEISHSVIQTVRGLASADDIGVLGSAAVDDSVEAVAAVSETTTSETATVPASSLIAEPTGESAQTADVADTADAAQSVTETATATQTVVAAEDSVAQVDSAETETADGAPTDSVAKVEARVSETTTATDTDTVATDNTETQTGTQETVQAVQAVESEDSDEETDDSNQAVASIAQPEAREKVGKSASGTTPDISADTSARQAGDSPYLPYANSVRSHIDASKDHFGEWQEGDFIHDEHRERLTDNIDDITDLSEKYAYDSGAELGRSVSKILNRVADEGVKPNASTVDTIESAVNEFDRTAAAISYNSSHQEIDPDILQNVNVTAETEVLGAALGSSLAAHELFAEDSQRKSKQSTFKEELLGKDKTDDSAKVSIDAPRAETELPEDAYMPVAPAQNESDVRFNDPRQLDSTILDIFLDEAQEIVKRNNKNIDDWKADYADLSALQEVQRGMHTLKGGARMAELTVLGDLSHHMETLLGFITDGQVDDKDGAYEILRKGLSLSADMVQQADAQQPVYESPEYLESLDSFVKEQTGKSIGYERKPASTPPATTSATAQAPTPLTAPMTPMAQTGSGEMQKRRSYTLRVSSELMDKLSGLVGEDSIARARLERNTLEHGFQLDELSRTIIRVGEQLRRLENETEAQILFRHETETDISHDFDPLELDRFSEIQQLSRLLSESMDDLQNLRVSLSGFVDENRQILTDQNNIQRELQDSILSASLVRFDSIKPRIETMVNQVARDMNKEVEVQIYGGQIEIERNMLEDLIPGFEHTIRNSVAHGIELPEERERSGKSPKGRIRVGARREGSEIWFIIADDGRGANLAAIRDKAKRLGILDESRAEDKNYLLQLLFEPGFTTAKSATQIFGRGIGLDVLKDVVNARRGSIEVETEENKGMATSIRMPFSMSITDALPIQVGKYVYAVPIMSVEGIARIPNDLYEPFSLGQTTYYSYGQNRYKLESLTDFIDPHAEKVPTPHGVPALLVRIGGRRIAFEVSEISNRQEIIIKSVNHQFTSLPGVIGAAVLNDGYPVPVLEIATLGRHFLSFQETGQDIRDRIELIHRKDEQVKTRILVVDDSITMRKVTTKILDKYDVEPNTAKDGLDAIDVINDWMPDLILLDIEMPRMDGFEFATHIRNNAETAEIPIIMITSRTGSKHRERADSIGVNDYLGKPYTEEVLVNAIENILEVKLEK